MFLVHDQVADNLVFTFIDPRPDRFDGKVREVDRFEYDEAAVHKWAPGEDRPEACVGRDRSDKKHFKVFRNRSDLNAAGFEPEEGNLVFVPSWSDYLRLRLTPPRAEQVDDETWYDYLDALDENLRNRRDLSDVDEPNLESVADVAKWVAKRHFVADPSVSEIWYLPSGSPENQIRLIEVSERIANESDEIVPVEFGLQMGETFFRLVVADVTSSLLQSLQQDPSKLPSGWAFNSAAVWRRRSP